MGRSFERMNSVPGEMEPSQTFLDSAADRPGERALAPKSRLLGRSASLVLWLVYGLVLAFVFESTYRAYPSTPIEAEQFLGWWTWHDQSHYLRSAISFASGSLASSQHHYPFGYALLAAPFASVALSDPFYPINLASFLVLAWALVS